MEEEAGNRAHTILIAEDEALVLKMLAYRLQKEGFTVLTAMTENRHWNAFGVIRRIWSLLI